MKQPIDTVLRHAPANPSAAPRHHWRMTTDRRESSIPVLPSADLRPCQRVAGDVAARNRQPTAKWERFAAASAWVRLASRSCSGDKAGSRNKLLISVGDQRLLLLRDCEPVKNYPVSTSKFGLGSQPSSYRAPLGRMEIARKIGDGQPAGMVFKGRRRTGEILAPNAPATGASGWNEWFWP